MAFVWTAHAVLSAFDAGIAEVIALHNRAYTMAMVNGTSLVGPHKLDLTPRFSVPAAYDMAMEQTVATLNAMEGTNSTFDSIIFNYPDVDALLATIA